MDEFEKIYTAYFNDVFYFVKKLCHNEHIAEEITSETFFKAMRSIDKFRGESDIRVWLCQIAKNTYYSYQKKQNRETAFCISEDFYPDSGFSVEKELLQKDDAMQLHQFLHNLPEPYKEVFSLRVFGELSFSQIGNIFSKSENWACVTYHRARQKIKRQWEDVENEKRL